jgi:fimbrial chaperone protein
MMAERRSFCHHPTAVRYAGKKDTLRIIDATNNQLPQDRETLFWMNVKAIPRWINQSSDNTLQLAIISRIKLYYRPANWRSAGSGREKAEFRRGNTLTLINPTPYYQTVTELNAGTRVLENALVPPMGEASVKLPSDAGREITYRTINDYGALTPK